MRNRSAVPARGNALSSNCAACSGRRRFNTPCAGRRSKLGADSAWHGTHTRHATSETRSRAVILGSNIMKLVCTRPTAAASGVGCRRLWILWILVTVGQCGQKGHDIVELLFRQRSTTRGFLSERTLCVDIVVILSRQVIEFIHLPVLALRIELLRMAVALHVKVHHLT